MAACYPGPMPRFALLFVLVAACDCGSTPVRPEVPCGRDGQSEACGNDCSAFRPCPDGLFCSELGQCDADCVSDDDCGVGLFCTPDGRCELIPPDVDASRGDAPMRDVDVCAQREVASGRVTPNVIIVVDQSGSMDERFGDSDRWNALRDSLLARPDGFIAALEDQVRFGLALFSGDGAAMCPILTTVPPAISNYDAIASVYGDAEIRDETPTGDSMQQLLDEILAAPDPTDDPTIFILATDGEPDTCEVPNPQEGQGEAIAAAQAAYAAGIRTYVISVGRDISEDHLQDMANAGLGRGAAGPDAPFWVAGDDDGLRDALSTIIGGALSCVVELEGRIDVEAACTGTVELNGLPVPCDDPDGWRAIDDTHIELMGESCERLQNDSTAVLRAVFPCEVIII